MTGPTQAQIDSAARHVLEDLERQDARTPRDAAIHSLGRDATEAEINRWLAVWRPEALAGGDTDLT